MKAVRLSPSIVFLALLLAGCAAGPTREFIHDDEAPAVPDVEKPQAPIRPAVAEEPEKAPEPPKPSPPRTLPQALCAYFDRLCSPNPPADAPKNGEKANGNGEKEKNAASEPKDPDKDGSSKNPPGKQEPDKTGGSSKNPPGDQAKPKNGANGPDQEKEKNGEDKGKGDDEKEKNGKEKDKDEKDKEPDVQWYSAHAQATMDTEVHDPFRAPYTGARSLLPIKETPTSLTATLFLDTRLWECDHYSAELVFNPEIAGGTGFSGVDGIAGFTDGDITRVGVVAPTPYFARLYLRQTWGLGGEQEKLEDAPNQIAGKQDIDRFTLSVGKFAFTDFIDNNSYSHDPRTQLQNWSMMYNGAWDYPANVRGYTYGAVADLNQKFWAIRYGITAEPAEANSSTIDPRFTEAFGQALEYECRWDLDEHPGRIRLMTYLNRAHMGSYAEALVERPIDPDVTTTRAYRYKYGFGLNVEQEVTKDLGVWARLGWSDGQNETWAFTPIDRTAALGLLLKGRCWARPDDQVGLGTAFNGLSRIHREYLAAGGLDFSIGDGQLNYAVESIIETYYRYQIVKGMYVIGDFQEVFNPAYNKDRGPVAVGSLLVHIEF